MTISDIKQIISGKGDGNTETVSSLEYSSKECRPGSAFFCFSGLHTDGSLYIADACAHGAVLAVTDHMPDEKVDGIEYIVTEKNIRSMYALSASAFFDNPWKKLVMIGVTGTDGKSSTSDFIYQLLKMQGKKCALLSTIYMDNGKGREYSPYRQSTPEAFQVQSFLHSALENGCTHAVIECTSHALSPEYDRLAGVHFIASAFTKISSEHMEFHKSMERYIGAKLRLATNTEMKNAFIYSDNKALSFMDDETAGKFTILEKPTVESINEDHIDYRYSGRSYTFPFSEEYMLQNGFEAAALVSRITEKPLSEVLEDARELKHIRGRSEHIQNTIGRNIIIDFAHTPDSFNSLFAAYRKLYKDGAFIAVFGAAGNRDTSKRAGLGMEAARFCEHIIITEEDPREESDEKIADDIISGIPEGLRSRRDIRVIDDRRSAIRCALELSNAGDTIFFLGKGHETSMEKRGVKIPYSEYAVVEEELRGCSCSCSKS